MTDDEQIGELVHAEMWRQRVPQVHLARALGITQTAVSRKIRGDRPWSAREVMAAARLLKVPTTALLPRPDSNGEPAG